MTEPETLKRSLFALLDKFSSYMDKEGEMEPEGETNFIDWARHFFRAHVVKSISTLLYVVSCIFYLQMWVYRLHVAENQQ